MSTVLDLITVIASGLGKLVLVSLGLAIIFGMMGIINLAHGEFIMVGAYATALSYHQGVPLIIAVLVGGVATGVLGVVVERLVIRHLYDRTVDSMVATWGLSLVLTQLALIAFGPSSSGIETPFGSVTMGTYSASIYEWVLAGLSIALIGAVYAVFNYTEYGLHARATIQNEEMARSLGIDTSRIYMITFFLGSVLTGLAGGLFAPTISLVPTLGGSYIIEAFVTVIVGGANVLIGVPASALSLSIINGGASQWGGALAGRVALLVTAIIIIRLMPEGLSEYIGEKIRQ
ncbi:ABC transporter permease subunit [Haladaptatus sp. CMSO5]|uniref:ABC transporter permease subunit n=1 Tax=Haladaptatus sp. CMSO5 TaxID=3120514 RepID=UPI002FCE56A2